MNELTDKGDPVGKYLATSATGMNRVSWGLCTAKGDGNVGKFLCDEVRLRRMIGEARQASAECSSTKQNEVE